MSDPTAPQRLFTFRSGGWVLLVAGLLTLGIFLWAIAGAFVRVGSPLIGDGTTVASYGFDLGACTVDRDLLVAGGVRKDALRSLDEPAVFPGRDVADFNSRQRGKYLVSNDRVIGVTLNGESRAYPLLVMQCHEIANDTLGGVPVAVTYNPLCDSVVVFDRRVGGEVIEFGVSGLLYNSNMLMYDRRPDGAGESLWCQLLGRAIAGPRVDTALTVLDAAVTDWAAWLAAHPGTTVLRPDPRMVKRYKKTSYDGYFRSAQLMFPVATDDEGPPAKDRVIVVTSASVRAVYLADEILRRSGSGTGGSGTWDTRLGETRLRFTPRPGSRTVTVTTDPPGLPVTKMYAMWFAWHAMQPQDRPVGPD